MPCVWMEHRLDHQQGLFLTGRIVQIDKDTACVWLHRAAVQCRLVMLYLWQGLSVTECQSYLVVELCAYQRAKLDQRQSAAGAGGPGDR